MGAYPANGSRRLQFSCFFILLFFAPPTHTKQSNSATHAYTKTHVHAYIHTYKYIPTRLNSLCCCRRRRCRCCRRRRQQRRLNCMRIFFIRVSLVFLFYFLFCCRRGRSVDLIYWQHCCCCCCACWKWKCVSMYVCLYVLQIVRPAKQKQQNKKWMKEIKQINKPAKLTNKISQQFFFTSRDLRDFICFFFFAT